MLFAAVHALTCEHALRLRAGTCKDHGCICDPYWLTNSNCEVNYIDIVGWHRWLVWGTAIAIHVCVLVAMAAACVRRRRRLCSMACGCTELGQVKQGGKAHTVTSRREGCGLCVRSVWSWRSVAEGLVAVASAVRIAFFVPSRRRIGHGLGVSLINVFLRVPQVMWVCAYLCLVVVWFDMVSFIRRASTGSRKRTQTGRKLKVTVLAVVSFLLAGEVALEIAAAMAVPYVDSAANFLIGLTVLVMVVAAFRFSRRALRAVKYLSEVSGEAAATDASLAIPRSSSSRVSSSHSGSSRGRQSSGDTRESLLNYDLSHPSAPSSAADMAATPMGTAPGGNSLAHRPAGGLGGSRSRSARHASRAVRMLFGGHSDDGSTVHESSSGGSVQEPPGMESSGSGPIRVEREGTQDAFHRMQAAPISQPQQLAAVPDWHPSDSVHRNSRGSGSAASSGPHGRHGASTIPATPLLGEATQGETSGACKRCTDAYCIACRTYSSSDPLLKLLARISTTTMAALSIGLVLFPTVAAMFAVPVNSRVNPRGYLFVQAIVFIAVEGSTAVFLALSIWPQRDSPPATLNGNLPTSPGATSAQPPSRTTSSALPIPEQFVLGGRAPSAYFAPGDLGAAGGFSLPHVPSDSSMTANPSPHSGANSSSSTLLARTAALDRQAQQGSSMNLLGSPIPPAEASFNSTSSRLRRDDSLQSQRRLHSGSVKTSGLVLGSGASIPSSLRSTRSRKR